MGSHPVVRLVEIAVAGLALMTGARAQEGADPSRRFFQAGYVDFWGSAPQKARSESDVYTEVTVTDGGHVQTYRPPRVVLDLLESPTEENARKYIAWQREKLKRIAAAFRAVRAAQVGSGGASSVRVTYLKRAGCPACRRQDEELAKLSGKLAGITLIDDPDILGALGVEAVPTLILTHQRSGRRKILTGLQTADAVLAAAAELERGSNENR